MKVKLTVTVDRELLPRAKRHARRQGTSLSSLIEHALRQASAPPGENFAERWRGQFKPAQRRDARYQALAKKYL